MFCYLIVTHSLAELLVARNAVITACLFSWYFGGQGGTGFTEMGFCLTDGFLSVWVDAFLDYQDMFVCDSFRRRCSRVSPKVCCSSLQELGCCWWGVWRGEEHGLQTIGFPTSALSLGPWAICLTILCLSFFCCTRITRIR